ncbi:MAG: hypothetical protein IJ149_00990 [Oscillospiraceae bacterium]|nr:hypothetical protein [Oscillospiraceae bacterium]
MNYKSLTEFLPRLQFSYYGEWNIDKENDGSAEHPIHMPYADYNNIVKKFIDAVYHFIDIHKELELSNYVGILENAGLKWNTSDMKDADVSELNGQTVMALIVGAIRAERFCDGALLGFFEDRCIERWLLRLREIDNSQN